MRKVALTFLTLLLAMDARSGIFTVGLDPKYYTSDFMMGRVAVAVIFPESNGIVDPNIENWSEDRQAQALAEIMAGHAWWTRQNPRSPLSFVYESHVVETKYEPITRPYYGEALWIPDVMNQLGYTGTRFTATRNFVNDLRDRHSAHWGFVVFVVDSLHDFNGKFADQYFAYAYLGGPFMVMTYDNNGYGIGNMDVVAAHETGHIFHALDEYAGASSPTETSSGYFVTVNGNHMYSSQADAIDSIMRGGLQWGLSNFTRQMIGWRDQDANGVDDILDQPPQVGFLSGPSASASGYSFSGTAALKVLARQGNSNGMGITVDSIAKVEYRLGDGEWQTAEPADGEFDSGEESFRIPIDGSPVAQSTRLSANDVDIRVVTTMELSSGGGGGPTVTSTGGGISDAHAFPNPFKPNAGLNHVAIKFTGLSDGAKVQVFSTTGEAVFESVAAGAADVEWNGMNLDGAQVATGVYFYLVTDRDGNTKKGKLAVVR